MLSMLSIIVGLLITASPIIAGIILFHILRGRLKPWWFWITIICSSLLIAAYYFGGAMQQKTFTIPTLVFVGTTIFPFAIGTGIYIRTRDVPHRMLAGWMIGAGFPLILGISLYIGAATSWTYAFEPEARRLIHILSQYHQQQRAYPDQVEALIENGNRVNEQPTGCISRLYTKKEDYYLLSYQKCATTEPFYKVDCTYNSQTKQWTCIDFLNMESGVEKSEPKVRELRTTIEGFWYSGNSTSH